MNEVERFTRLKTQVQQLEVNLQVKRNELQNKEQEIEKLLTEIESTFGTRDVQVLLQRLSELKTETDSKLKALEGLING
jgi:predicted transport protein